MADHIFDHHKVAAAFRFSSHWWRSLVGAIDDHRWDHPALGDWSIRELVAHTDRAYKTLLEYSEGEVRDGHQLYSAAAYYRTVLREETPHVHIAARAKREAHDEEDWVVATDRLADEAEKLVARLAPDHVMHLMVGEMRLDQYLATRVVELVVHGLDLAAAIDLPTSAPAPASRVALTVLLDLAGDDDLSSILRLLSGRAAALPLTHVLD